MATAPVDAPPTPSTAPPAAAWQCTIRLPCRWARLPLIDPMDTRPCVYGVVVDIVEPSNAPPYRLRHLVSPLAPSARRRTGIFNAGTRTAFVAEHDEFIAHCTRDAEEVQNRVAGHLITALMDSEYDDLDETYALQKHGASKAGAETRRPMTLADVHDAVFSGAMIVLAGYFCETEGEGAWVKACLAQLTTSWTALRHFVSTYHRGGRIVASVPVRRIVDVPMA